MGHLIAGCGLGVSAAGCAAWAGASAWQAALLYSGAGAGTVLLLVAAALLGERAARVREVSHAKPGPGGTGGAA